MKIDKLELPCEDEIQANIALVMQRYVCYLRIAAATGAIALCVSFVCVHHAFNPELSDFVRTVFLALCICFDFIYAYFLFLLRAIGYVNGSLRTFIHYKRKPRDISWFIERLPMYRKSKYVKLLGGLRSGVDVTFYSTEKVLVLDDGLDTKVCTDVVDVGTGQGLIVVRADFDRIVTYVL